MKAKYELGARPLKRRIVTSTGCTGSSTRIYY